MTQHCAIIAIGSSVIHVHTSLDDRNVLTISRALGVKIIRSMARITDVTVECNTRCYARQQ